jgi:hypothetical protein
MNLEGAITEMFALSQFGGNVRIASRSGKSRKPVEAGHDPVFDLSSGHITGPANDRWNPQAAFQDGALGASEGRIAAVAATSSSSRQSANSKRQYKMRGRVTLALEVRL